MINKLITNIFKCCLLIVICSHTAFAQSYSADSIKKKFDHYRINNLQEKIFAHVNQNFFMVGETAWFSIYCVDGSFHKASSLSKVAYVEVIDQFNKSVIQAKIELTNGLGNGSFFLPATIASGNYTFRAYTNWMKNFSPDFFYHQEISIVNPFVKPEVPKPAISKNIIIDFFPEGGYLVDGLKSKVAFKLTDNAGKFINGKIAVINSSGDTVARSESLKFGLGNFILTPVAGVQYKGVTNDAKGNVVIQPLPEVKSSGAVMTVIDDGNTLSVNVTRNATDIFEVMLIAHSRNVVFKTEAKRFVADQLTFSIEKSQIPDGISHLTIFNQDDQPVCERLYFKRPAKPLAINFTTTPSEIKTRRKISIPLTISNGATTQFSVSVTRDDSLSTMENQDIGSYLWLASDIKGTIESPQFYFSSDPFASQAADNLMLSQGWRRFSWTDVFRKSEEKKFAPEYRGHIIAGNVKLKNDSSVAGIAAFLSTPGKVIHLYVDRADVNGSVLFEPSDFFGPQKLVLQTEPRFATSADMQIINPFSSSYAKRVQSPFSLNAGIENILLDRSVSMQVQDVYYEETGATPTATVVDSIGFYGTADETYYLDDYTRFPVMEEVMREYVPGVLVRKRRDGFHFIVLDIVNGGVLNDNPMILIDGVPMFDADNIMAVDPRIIRKLEVVKRNYYVGSIKVNGIVSYTSYQGNIGADVNPANVVLNYEGLQVQREFYSPRYDTQKQIDSRMPDRRYQLYWNPSTKTNADGTALIEFYTSDVQGTFTIDVQALDNNGNAGHLRKTFTVK